MFERGEIRNEHFAGILNNFGGMQRHRKITPTDIDGIIDYNGNAFIILEGKFKDTEMPAGQKFALQHLCDAINAGGKYAICLVFTHNCAAGDQVQVADCIVTKVYYNGNWTSPKDAQTVIQFVERIENYCQNALGIQI